MSSRPGSSSGTVTVGTAGLRVSSQCVPASQRKDPDKPTGRISPETVSADGRSAQARESAATVGEEGSVSRPKLLHSAGGHRRSVGVTPDCARQGEAGTDRRAAVLGYASADAREPERASAELRQQMQEIASECERRGVRLLEVVRERKRQHQRPLGRPGLGYALGRIAAGEANGLVVSDLSCVSRSLPELGRVLEWLANRDARFVAAGPGLDTGEEAGSLAVRTIIEVSRWERQRLVERTRNGMRAARRKGPASVADYPELRERIAGMRAAGLTLQAIADRLNAEGVPTVRGGAKWRPSSVQAGAGYHRPSVRHMLAPQARGWDGTQSDNRRG
jgi:DNA invertase Pin-like site-specific DNA recombinase